MDAHLCMKHLLLKSNQCDVHTYESVLVIMTSSADSNSKASTGLWFF